MKETDITFKVDWKSLTDNYGIVFSSKLSMFVEKK